ncbi:MAG: rhomboid family intramembrane serine protease [Candidatus Zixiibacteriota bacterium]|nr:MAG: rhomboid family intramembrane serine protease [candidate division Zixibacteria bacterium]
MFIPIKDDIPTRRTPHVTLAIIFINTVVFLYSQTLGATGYRTFVAMLGFTPGYYLNLGSEYIAPTWYYLTPITSMFLHGGWMHLIGNMLYLWIVGNNIEDYFGPIKYVIFYIVSGIAATALFALFDLNSTVPLIGASGAVAGVMGAYLVLHPRARITVLIVFIFIMFRQFPAKMVLLFWFGLEVFNWVVGSKGGTGIAHMAHIGGFAFGWLALKAITKIRGEDRSYRISWR